MKARAINTPIFKNTEGVSPKKQWPFQKQAVEKLRKNERDGILHEKIHLMD